MHESWDDFLAAETPPRLFFASTKGNCSYLRRRFEAGDYLVFGNESSGLPADMYEEHADRLFVIPMPGQHARSHNLANAVAIVVYEAYRQLSGEGPE